MPSNDRYSISNGTQPTVTRTVTKSVVPASSTDLVDPDLVFTKKHEEWTTSKRTVNHKTKQVETRVQRQLVLEDGRVVADSGPQVTTNTKEDVTVEESENTEHKSSGDEAPGSGYVLVPGSARVVSEKTESNQTVRETREENRQMHDERLRELTGEEIHQRTIISPDDPSFAVGAYPGKLTHYSSRSQKVVDKDEVKEVSELLDGQVSTETTRTHHHEEAFDDEVPEEEAEDGMVPERSGENSRTLQYYTDPLEFEREAQRLQEESRRSRSRALAPGPQRWVSDHFGAQRGIESARTRSGGNRITIEMSPHRTSSPIELSPRETPTKSRESTLRKSNHYQSSSSPYPSNTLRSTSSPFEVYSSSGSSRSKTPVKTYYLGEDNAYWKKKPGNQSFNDGISSVDSNSLGRSNLSGHYGERSDSFYRVPKSKMSDPPRYDAFANGHHHKSDKHVQAALSDDDHDLYRRKTTSTVPRVIKVMHETTKSPSYSSLSAKHYKSSDSLHHSPGYDRNSSPIYNNVARSSDWGSDTYSKRRTHEVKVQKKNGVLSNRSWKDSNPNWFASPSSSLKTRRFPASPPESGYQSPFPPTPPSSPPPRNIKVLHSDNTFTHYGSSSSMSPPDSPVHPISASIRKKATYPSGSASRSKSSSDLRTSNQLFGPDAFTPLSSPLKLKTVGDKSSGSDHQKYYRVKPGDDRQSVTVQIRDWSAR